MSEFLKHPEFEGAEEFKALVDSMFEGKSPSPIGPVNKEPFESQTQAPRRNYPTRKVNIPDVAPLSENKTKQAVRLGRKEMELVRQKFLDFQDQISDTEMYSFLFRHIEEFAHACEDMVDLIENDFKLEDLTGTGQEDYDQVLKIRNRILSAIYDRYKK